MTRGHEPALPSGPEAIARARREIAAVEAELRAGNTDVHGLARGLVDWSCELRRLEQNEKSPPGLEGGGGQKGEPSEATV
jgi:hypothetical protein